ncbi:MAG TPA: OmpW family protein, partial [Rhizobiales bacterium]|nr:OmpW family protein [Hyphomicrobiales bacterium]
YFFTDNISAELILGTTKHKATAVGTSAGDIALGKVWLLPPTLTLQYHLAPDAAFNPYVGAGLNYTIFYSESTKGTVLDNIDYSNSFGVALQAGADIKPNPDSDWFFNVDVKKVWLNTDVKVDATTALGAVVNAKVDVNPWLFGVGVGKRF